MATMDAKTLKQFEVVVRDFEDKVEFDSHDFIFKYIEKFEEDYIRMLQPVKDGFQILDSWFGRALLDNQNDLGIRKMDESSISRNIKGNDTSCAKWEIIK